MTAIIPLQLSQDKYWKPVIYLFKNHSKLNKYFNTRYFDLEEGTIKIASLKKQAAPWSHSEKFMLNLACHLFNERNKVNLSDMDYLDDYNRKLAFEALKMRFY